WRQREMACKEIDPPTNPRSVSDGIKRTTGSPPSGTSRTDTSPVLFFMAVLLEIKPRITTSIPAAKVQAAGFVYGLAEGGHDVGQPHSLLQHRVAVQTRQRKVRQPRLQGVAAGIQPDLRGQFHDLELVGLRRPPEGFGLLPCAESKDRVGH